MERTQKSTTTRRHIIIALLIGLAFLVPWKGFGQTNADQVTMGQSLQLFFSDLEKKGGFSGAVYAAKDGQAELNQGFGYADRADSIPITPNTVFKIGGLTKTFTAALALYLETAGRLVLTDPIVRRLPDFAVKNAERVTSHHLLTHTSGIPDYFLSWKTAWLMKFGEENPPRGGSTAVIEDLLRYEPRFDPGSHFDSSNSGYMLLAKVIEKAAGESYQGYAKDALTALGLQRTGFDLTREIAIRDRAVGRELPSSVDPRSWLSKPRYRPVAYRHHEWDFATTGMYSTLRDLQAWDEILSGDRLLNAEARRKMFFKHAKKAPAVWYGYGWEINETNGVPIFVQSGATQGFLSFMARVPERRTCVIVLSSRALPLTGRMRMQRDLLSLIAQHLNRQPSGAM